MKTKTMKITGLLLTLVMMVSLLGMFSLTASAAAATDLTVTIDTGASVTLQDTDGDGYYDIGTADELYAFAAAVNGGNNAINGELTANIVVNPNVLTSDGNLNGDGSNFRVWTPIGYYTSAEDEVAYVGIFDGGKHTVSGLYFNNNTINEIGLFGDVSTDGKVTNVGVVDSYFYGLQYVGGVVGYNTGTVQNCYNMGTVSGENNVGGVAARNWGGSVTDCYNAGTVNGGNDVGGVVGNGTNDTIEHCYNTGDVSGSNNVGGIIGYQNGGNTQNCYNTGTVSGSKHVGGIVGYFLSGTVENCYNANSVSGTQNFGGVIGSRYSSSVVSNSYFDSTKHSGSAIGLDEGTTADVGGKTSEQFASGEVAYLLGSAFGQNIDNGKTVQTVPVLSGAAVYSIQNCKNETLYSNTNENIGHQWENGTCTICSESCTHTGGEATCTEKAICETCGASYGDVGGHSFDENGACTLCGILQITGYAPGWTDENGADVVDFHWGADSQVYVELWDANGKLHSETVTAKPDASDDNKMQFTLAGNYEGTPTRVLAAYGFDGELKATMPDTFTQQESGNPDFLNNYMLLYGSAAYGQQVNFTHVPAILRFVIAHTGYPTTLYNVSLRVVDEDGNDYFAGGSQVVLGATADGWEADCTLASEPTGITTSFGDEGTSVHVEQYIAYAMALPVGNDATFRGKTLQIILCCQDPTGAVEPGEHKYVIYEQDMDALAAQQGGVYDWVSGRCYTFEIDTTCYNGCTFTEEDGTVCTVCNTDCAHKNYTYSDNGDGTHDYGCDECGYEVASENHTATYSASGNIITESCSANCGHTATATIIAENTTYNGTEQMTATVTYSKGWTGGELTVSYENNVNAGTAAAKITIGEATAQVDFTIAKATPTINDFDIVFPSDLTYNGEAKTATVTVKDGIIGMGEITVNYQFHTNVGPVEQLDTINAGMYTVVIRVAEGDNYEAHNVSVGDFTILSFELGLGNIAMYPGKYTYNGTEQVPEITVVVDGKTLIFDEDYTITWDKEGFINAGTYTATVSGIGNYTGSVNKSYAIKAKDLLDSDISIDITEATYDGNAHTPIITVKDGENNLLEGTDYEISWDKNGFVNADTYTVTITGKGNYSGSFTRTLVINKADVEIELTSPITSVLPGNQIALTLNTNSDATPVWNLSNASRVEGTVSTIKVNDGLVIGQDKVTITVTYAETTNVKGGEKTIELEVGMADFSGAIADLEEKINDLGETYATDAELKVELDALKEAIENLKSADTATAEDISDINEKIESIKTTYAAKADLDAAVARLDELTKNGGTIEQINAEIKKINDALTTLDAENRLDAAETSLNTLLTTTIPGINKLISDNSTAIGTNASEIATLKTTVDGIQTTLTSLDTEDERLAGLISGLDTELDGLAGSLNTLAERVTAAEQELDLLRKDLNDQYSKLVDLINANTLDIGTINTALTSIETTLTTLATKTDVANEVNTLTGLINSLTTRVTDNEAGISANAGEINTLKSTVEALATELRGADETLTNSVNGLSSALSALTERVTNAETAIENLDKVIADLDAAVKAGDKELSDKIAALNTALANAKAALEKADADNKAELVSKIETADATLDAAIKAVQKNLDDAQAALNKAIADGDTALDGKISDLNTALESAKAALEATDAANKTELEGKITDAQTSLQAAINNVQTNLDNAKAELDKAIADLDAAMKQGDADLSAEIANLNTALTNAKAALEKADADNKAELVNKIETADATLDAAIKAVQKNLDDAKTELDTAIKNGDTALDGKISNLNAALESAKAALEATDAANKTELEGKITSAQTSLQAAIDQVQTNLDSAKAELDKAIADLEAAMKQGDADLSTEIANLNTALTNAKAALEKADADNKAELVKKIDDADATLDAAIKAVQKNLDDAQAALNKAIADGDTALDGRITDLNTALETAKAALEATDAANKSELEGKITEAQTTLQSAIDKVAKDLADAEKELADAIASGDAALGSRISSVSASLSAAKTALEKADADNKAELIAKIEAAESTLDAAIKAVQKNLDDAKAALEKALADGDKANADALAQAISDLNAAIDAAETAAATADGSLKTELTSKIDNADAALQAAVDALSTELDATNEKVDQLETFIIIVCVISGVALCGSGAFVVWFFIDRKKRI